MKWFILALFIVCATVVHFRGRVRHRFSRQALDHSTFTAPLNCFMYAFSSVPNQPYLDLKDFPELKVLLDRCDEIREEALRLFGDRAYQGIRQVQRRRLQLVLQERLEALLPEVV